MAKLTLIFLTLLFTNACLAPPPPKAIISPYPSHYSPKITSSISSKTGNELLGEINAGKYEALKSYWVAQKKNYCGICSAVIVLNTARQNHSLTQDNIFSNEVNSIILPETVSKMGLTLRELTEILKAKAPDFNTQKFPAHTSGLDLFKRQLKANSKNKSFMITNFSRQSIAGTGMARGHYSIIAGYHEESQKVLVLEVNGAHESFWISAKDLFIAMTAIDPVSQIPRGWIITGK